MTKPLKNTCIAGLFGCIVGASCFAASPAVAQSHLCTDHGKMVKTLNGQFQERRHGLGIAAANSGVMELFLSDAGSWTVVITMVNGVSCVLAAGHAWQDTSKTALGPET